MAKQTTQQILNNAIERLKQVELQLHDVVNSSPENKLRRLREFVAFARSIENILVQLKQTEKSFSTWGAKYQKELAEDELLRFFNTARNNVLKEGIDPSSGSIGTIHSTEPLSQMGRPPVNAVGRGFDNYGRPGWVVRDAHGTETFLPVVDMPPSTSSLEWFFHNAPSSHLGSDIRGCTLDDLCKLYFEYFSSMVYSAGQRFGTPSESP